VVINCNTTACFPVDKGSIMLALTTLQSTCHLPLSSMARRYQVVTLSI